MPDVMEDRRPDRRAEIISAARGVFAREGYEKTSMRAIAAALSLSPTALYLYFENKEQLLAEVCRESVEHLLALLEHALAAHPDPVEALKAACQAYIDFGCAHPEHYRLLMMMPGSPQVEGRLEPSSQRVLDHLGDRAFQVIGDGVARAITAGRLKDVNIQATTELLWAGMHGVTALLITLPSRVLTPAAVLRREFIDTVLAGLAR